MEKWDITYFLTSFELAQKLHLPERWLINEAKSFRLPYLQVGGTMMFDIDKARHKLISQMKNNT
jgi:hypothetical protein